MNLREIERKLNMIIPEEAKKDLKTALRFYRKFHWGDEFKEIKEFNIKIPKVVFTLYHLVAFIGITQKGGEEDFYIHVFKPPFPILAGSKNPDRLWILGGNYRIEEEGVIG